MVSVRIEVKGIVQGVGFRPFIYNLALKYKIKGWVNNDDKGVNISLQCSQEILEQFLYELKNNAPVLSKIDSLDIQDEKDKTIYDSFEIIQSQNSNNKSTIISPDIAVCDDCINDINDPTNFRADYALTNCTNCGPRYSIIKTVPYDRCNTSMNEFNLCEACEKEYKDPTNRRYHAQPVSCEKCGPNVSLYNTKDEVLSTETSAIKQIATLIKEGNIVAIKGLGGFHLVCDATNDKVVEELRLRKNRPNKPFALMFKNINSVKDYTQLSSKEEEVINSKEKPITLVKKQKNTNLSSFISPNIDRQGCFMAYTPLHHLLFRYLDNPIVATSANLKDEPIIRFKDEIIEKLSSVVDYVLDFNRDIINACDDSVVQVVNDDISKLRNARGYAPTAIKLPKKIDKKILALGANQKSTIAIAFDDNLILSPHIADLNSIESVEYFKRTIETFKDFYDFTPDIVVYDKHPLYESTKYVDSLKMDNFAQEYIQIQHHYAHALSVMAEYNLDKKVLAFCFDGTGYGDDDTIWGGEVFICDSKDYERVNYIKNFKLFGGEKAVKEPKRVALSLLFDSYTFEEIQELEIELINEFSTTELKMMYMMWQKGLNAPNTSSVGRVFDAIASFANLCHTQSYEGETGLQIEQNYDKTISTFYDYEIIDNQIDLSLMIKQIINEKDPKYICTKFINTLCQIILDISSSYSSLDVVLTGGVFQNKTLLELVSTKLKEENKNFYYSKQIPLNDAGISVGQIYSQI